MQVIWYATIDSVYMHFSHYVTCTSGIVIMFLCYIGPLSLLVPVVERRETVLHFYTHTSQHHIVVFVLVHVCDSKVI